MHETYTHNTRRQLEELRLRFDVTWRTIKVIPVVHPFKNDYVPITIYQLNKLSKKLGLLHYSYQNPAQVNSILIISLVLTSD